MPLCIWKSKWRCRRAKKLTLPPDLVDGLGPGRWRVLVEPAEDSIRRHDAFLAGYAAEDEGLYDDSM
jgi:hypothetical protein